MSLYNLYIDTSASPSFYTGQQGLHYMWTLSHIFAVFTICLPTVFVYGRPCVCAFFAFVALPCWFFAKSLSSGSMTNYWLSCFCSFTPDWTTDTVSSAAGSSFTCAAAGVAEFMTRENRDDRVVLAGDTTEVVDALRSALGIPASKSNM